jgi:hypothetical protein
MFARWKRRRLRRLKPWSPPDDSALHAVLVESHRVDGRPRQRVVRHLGTIRERELGKPLSVDRFWRDVDGRLAALGLDDGRRRAVEATLARRVPRPDPAELARGQAEFERFTASLVAIGGRRRRER